MQLRQWRLQEPAASVGIEEDIWLVYVQLGLLEWLLPWSLGNEWLLLQGDAVQLRRQLPDL